MEEIPYQMQTVEDITRMQAINIPIYVIDIEDLNGEPVDSGFITNWNETTIWINEKPYDRTKYGFLTR